MTSIRPAKDRAVFVPCWWLLKPACVCMLRYKVEKRGRGKTRWEMCFQQRRLCCLSRPSTGWEKWPPYWGSWYRYNRHLERKPGQKFRSHHTSIDPIPILTLASIRSIFMRPAVLFLVTSGFKNTHPVPFLRLRLSAASSPAAV